METLILDSIKNEKFKGIIPVSPVKLEMKFNKKSFSPNFGAILLMFIISLPLTLFFLAIVSFIMSDIISGSIISIISAIILSLVVISLPTYIVYVIYIKKIKKYPVTLLAVTKENLHFFIIKDNQIDLHHKFDLSFDELQDNFYGEIDAKTKIVKTHFQIRVNNVVKLKGELKIAQNRFNEEKIKEEFLLPFDELVKIYLA